MTARNMGKGTTDMDTQDDGTAGSSRQRFALSALRGHRLRTQAQLASAIGTTQSAVSRLERQPDLLVSTLNEFVAATGGRLRLIADFGDYEAELLLPALQPIRSHGRREFKVVWQNLQTRQLVHVGWLRIDNSRFSFEYTLDAQRDLDFQPFPAFPDLSAEYSATELFPFFGNRVAATADRGVGALADALGVSHDSATPVELLARSWGKSSHDTIQIIPEPDQRPDGTKTRLFLVSGISHADEDNPSRVAKLVAGLKHGQRVDVRSEPENPVDSDAVVLERGGQRIGWIPAYLLADVHESGLDRVDVVVEKANGEETPWHLRLLCRLIIRPTLTPA